MSKQPPSQPPPAVEAAAGFEGALKELEDIVARMERGDLPLQESMSLFERGTVLTRECRAQLDAAELRVRNLLETSPATPPTTDP